MRGNQGEYKDLLDQFGSNNKDYQESVNHLVSQGYTFDQAKTAVYVYFKGGPVRASRRLQPGQADEILDNIGGRWNPPHQLIDELMRDHSLSFRQAQSAVYKYRKVRGLVRDRR